MEALSENPQLAIETAKLLGQELVIVRRRLQELQQQREEEPQADNHETLLLDVEQEPDTVQTLKVENAKLLEDIANLKSENSVLKSKDGQAKGKRRVDSEQLDRTIMDLNIQLAASQCEVKHLEDAIGRGEQRHADTEQKLARVREKNKKLKADLKASSDTLAGLQKLLSEANDRHSETRDSIMSPCSSPGDTSKKRSPENEHSKIATQASSKDTAMLPPEVASPIPCDVRGSSTGKKKKVHGTKRTPAPTLPPEEAVTFPSALRGSSTGTKRKASRNERRSVPKKIKPEEQEELELEYLDP